MILTRTVTKKVLEKIVHQTFSTFGSLSSSSLLDSFKLLGFYYATTAGLSITIEDLKTPKTKKKYIQDTEQKIAIVSDLWQKGKVSETERFQTIIARWNLVTDELKNRIVNYYENFDPANNLYIMAFSGARGNLSQVRQLVGMRGLMSDQEGKIIDLPIKTNFREGLSSLDYLISSYGARKGIVDTALKTADSGYLTRRLIYLAQDLVIREKNCHTKKGILISLNSETTEKSPLGRFLISAYSLKKEKIDIDSQFLTLSMIKKLKKDVPLTLKVRSPLTCNSLNSICQYCYGWDLSKDKVISLGEAVGILAAQSIGEPGTQLTMRTFHTGGVFTSEIIDQLIAPFSGQLLLPSFLPSILVRTNQGKQVLKIKQEISLRFRNWKGKEEFLSIRPGSFLYHTSSKFLKKGELIAEFLPENVIPQKRRLKSIITKLEGEIRFEGICRSISKKDNQEISLTEEDGILWIDSGKLFALPKETNFLFPKKLIKRKTFSYQNIASPYSGIAFIKNKIFTLVNAKKKIQLDLKDIRNIENQNFTLKISFLIKNYQFIDAYTILGKIYNYPKKDGKVYAIRKKRSKTFSSFFLITDSDIWQLSVDQINNFSKSILKKGIIKNGEKLNESIQTKSIGKLLKKDGCEFIFQQSTPTFLSAGTLLSYKGGDLISKRKKLATLIDSTQQTEDIVQGLPKIEDLIEARVPKEKAILCLYPGISLGSFEENNQNLKTLKETIYKKKKTKEIFEFYYYSKNSEAKRKVKKTKRQKDEKILSFIHAIRSTENLVVCDNKIWEIRAIPKEFVMIAKLKRDEFNCQIRFTKEQEKHLQKLKEIRRERNQTGRAKTIQEERLFEQRPKARRLLVPTQGSRNVTTWERQKSAKKFYFEKLKGKTNNNRKKIKEIYFNSRTTHWIIETENNELLLFTLIDSQHQYTIPFEKKILSLQGGFVDSGEPVTEGLVDPHEFLLVLFSFHLTLEDPLLAVKRSVNKFQLLLLHSIQSIYQSQGVTIANSHIELIVRQLTAKIKITSPGTTPFIPGEIHSLAYMSEIYQAFQDAKKLEEETKKEKTFHPPIFEPIFLSTTNSSLTKKGFLAAAGFQETKRVLTTAAIEGKADWFQGLKECIIVGRLIPAGTAFFTYKNNLDNLFLFKRKPLIENEQNI